MRISDWSSDVCSSDLQSFDIGRPIVMERDERAARAEFDARDARPFRVELDLDQPEQVFGRIGELAEPVDQFGGEGFETGLVIELVAAANEAPAQKQFGNVSVWDQDHRSNREKDK